MAHKCPHVQAGLPRTSLKQASKLRTQPCCVPDHVGLRFCLLRAVRFYIECLSFAGRASRAVFLRRQVRRILRTLQWGDCTGDVLLVAGIIAGKAVKAMQPDEYPALALSPVPGGSVGPQIPSFRYSSRTAIHWTPCAGKWDTGRQYSGRPEQAARLASRPQTQLCRAEGIAAVLCLLRTQAWEVGAQYSLLVNE